MTCCVGSSKGISIFGTSEKVDYVVQLKKVRLATTGDLGGVYNAGTITVVSPLLVDGVAVALFDRILVKDQADPLQNGIYRVVEIGVNTVLVRVADFQPACFASKIVVEEGATLAQTLWFFPKDCSFVFDTDPINFINDGGAAGAGDITNAANVGGGAEVFKQKVGPILEFRTLVEGTGISIVQAADTLTISTTGTATNLVYTMTNIEIVVNSAIPWAIGYFPWDQSEFAAYTSGQLTFYADIVDQEIELTLVDVVAAVNLATFTTTGTGSYTIATLIPAADTYIRLDVNHDGTAGSDTSTINGVILTFII